MRKFIGVLILGMLFLGGAVMAHSGGTDKYGCHWNHKTGIYHCH